MERLLLHSGLLVALLTVSTAAQDQTPIRVWLDATSYAYFEEDSLSYVEFCSAIQRTDLQFEDVDTSTDSISYYIANPYLYIEVFDQSGLKVDSLGKYFPVPVIRLEDAYNENVRVFDCMGAALRPGKYQAKMTVVDLNTRLTSESDSLALFRSGVASCDIEVRDFEEDKLAISDLELAYKITTVSDSVYSPLIKAGRKVIPNPNGYFSDSDTMVHLYFEVYNLAKREGKSDEFEVEIKVMDSFGYDLRETPTAEYKKPGASAVLSESISLGGLPGGEYYLQVRVRDVATGRAVAARKKLHLVYSFDQLSPTMRSPDSFTEEDAELMAKVIHYISSKDEKNTYQSLGLEGKKNFLASFWEDRNPNKGSKVNVYKNEMFRRFMYANYYYSNSLISKEDGWRSERGRVYITYGEPDEIERHPSSMGGRPYERWDYYRLPDQRGGDFFIFVDKDGYGNYQLMHSTLRGEISNPRWEAELGIEE